MNAAGQRKRHECDKSPTNPYNRGSAFWTRVSDGRREKRGGGHVSLVEEGRGLFAQTYNGLLFPVETFTTLSSSLTVHSLLSLPVDFTQTISRSSNGNARHILNRYAKRLPWPLKIQVCNRHSRDSC